MRILKSIWKRWHVYVSWALFSVIMWGWIITLVTDTTPRKKLSVFIDSYACEDKALSMKLEEDKPEGIRMIKVHPFSYALFGETGFTGADIYVIRASQIEVYITDFLSIEAFAKEHPEYGYYHGDDGKPYGIKVYDTSSGDGAAQAYITYKTPANSLSPAEDYYLFFGKASCHVGNKEDDSLAFKLAEMILKLE